MNAWNQIAKSQAGEGIRQYSGDLEAGAGFGALEKSRQILVFQTIQEAISSVPPRLEATFPRVVAAYSTLSLVVEAAANGQLSDELLARLEADVDAAGGVIAPGLWSQGDNSIAAFRAATFGTINRNFRPPVVDAACAALNARLQTLKLNDLGLVFQVVASFFSPITPSTSNAPKLQAFDALDTDRQVLVFRTIQDAILASPPRAEASFSAVVSAFQSEMEVLQNAAEGRLNDESFARLEGSIEAAGGVLAPGTYAQGKQSIAAFRSETFKALDSMLPPEVLSAAVSALNARLKELRPAGLPVLFKAIHTFFMPLLAQGWNSPSLQGFKTLDPHRQALVFQTIEDAISTRPDLETTIFPAAVKAIAAEQSLIASAQAGNLVLSQLESLRSAIEECGGSIAPGIRSSGEGSIGDFIDTCFTSLKRDMSPEVCQAVIDALNAKLRSVPITRIDDLIGLTRTFVSPLLSAMQLNTGLQSSPRNETLPPAEPYQVQGVILVPPLERELPQSAPAAEAVPESNPYLPASEAPAETPNPFRHGEHQAASDRQPSSPAASTPGTNPASAPTRLVITQIPADQIPGQWVFQNQANDEAGEDGAEDAKKNSNYNP